MTQLLLILPLLCLLAGCVSNRPNPHTCVLSEPGCAEARESERRRAAMREHFDRCQVSARVCTRNPAEMRRALEQLEQ